ncbi:hypothetical protein J3A84_13385 [Proteiniclasticum sp. SCR006]|uniref:Type IV pilus assembly protein PilO n=1 Tax=Proteiniclasticum aestuarii TaxID=2817862 RepID=A0A939KLU0_9CLOT|nr:hypothetical protein [Proteiniclasticum aestuarii]MBO1266025.1 hypothetical protein [Proteiniclasticum aestuarii]
MERLKNETFQIKLLIVLIFILINIALIFFIGIPRIRSVDDVAMEHNEKLLRVELMLANERVIDEKEAEIKNLRMEVEGFEDMVPDYIDYPQVIHDFNIYSLENEVAPQYLSFSDAVVYEEEVMEKPEEEHMEENLLSTLTLNFSASGTSEKIIRFLQNLDDISSLALAVENVTLYHNEENQLNVDITFRQYVRGLEASGKPYEEYSFYLDSIGFENLSSLFTSSDAGQISEVDQEPPSDAYQDINNP